MDKPLDSIAAHLGKLVDNSNVEQMTDLAASLLCSYMGYRAARQLGGTQELSIISGGGSGLIAFKLAKSANMVAGASGVVTLASLGLVSMYDPLASFFAGIPDVGKGFSDALGQAGAALGIDQPMPYPWDWLAGAWSVFMKGKWVPVLP